MTDHPIPLDALDSDIAILGRKGGGKSYTAKGIVERLLDLGRRVLVLDPLGVWAGLRTGADGESAGYPIAIFGGLHADLPLDLSAAEPLARIIAAENLPAVIDLSELSKGKQQAFLFAFLHELRTVNREALTIVLEEADVFAPQNPQGDDSKQLHGEIDWIARRGRFRGFRLITITQRPARLSKDVLTQCATLIAHRLPAPQDRDAVKAWVDGNGDKDKAKEVFDTLAQLAIGEAWVWAPEHDLLERVKFPIIKTFDTSSTPKAGERRIEAKTLAQVDVSAIRAALETVAPETTKAVKNIPQNITVDLQAAEKRGYDAGYKAGRDAMRSEAIERVRDAMITLGTDAPTDAQATFVPAERQAMPTAPAKAAAATKPEKAAKVSTDGPRAGHVAAGDKLLGALVRYPDGLPSWADVAIVAGMASGNGYFYGGKKHLLDYGFAVEVGGVVRATDAGNAAAGGAGTPASLREIVETWSGKLKQPAPVMLAHIAKVGSITMADLADATGIKPGNGYWYGGIKAMRAAGLTLDDKSGVRLVPLLSGAAR